MVEPFCSEYGKNFREFDREPEPEGTRTCLYFNYLKENFLPSQDSKTIYNQERDDVVIKDLQLKRLMSTYQATYCSSVGKKSLVIDPDDLEADQFIVYFNKYYAERTQPLLRPLDTARRVNGYSRFSHFYTGKSMYQETIGKEAYKYFKREYDQGKSRLFGKKQQALKKLREGNLEEETTGNTNNIEKDGSEKKKNEEREERDEFKEYQNGDKRENSPDKICMLCREKFVDYSSPPPENEIKNLNQIEKCTCK